MFWEKFETFPNEFRSTTLWRLYSAYRINLKLVYSTKWTKGHQHTMLLSNYWLSCCVVKVFFSESFWKLFYVVCKQIYKPFDKLNLRNWMKNISGTSHFSCPISVSHPYLKIRGNSAQDVQSITINLHHEIFLEAIMNFHTQLHSACLCLLVVFKSVYYNFQTRLNTL